MVSRVVRRCWSCRSSVCCGRIAPEGRLLTACASPGDPHPIGPAESVALVACTADTAIALTRGAAADGSFELVRRFAGRRLEIVGFGQIGAAVAERAAHLDVEVVCSDEGTPPGIDHRRVEILVDRRGVTGAGLDLFLKGPALMLTARCRTTW